MSGDAPPQGNPPPAIAALDMYPWLRTTVEQSLIRQAARIQERMTTFVERRAVLEQLRTALHSLPGGLIALEGPPGSGVTTLLAHLAATQPFAFWFADDDAGQGAAALHAQLIGLHRLSIPLIAPAAATDPLALERLLDEVTTQPASATPLVLLVDPPACAIQPLAPVPIPFPTRLPPHVLVVYGCTPESSLPFTPDARISLTAVDNELVSEQVFLLQAGNGSKEWGAPLMTAARGNFLYLRLAYALLQQGIVALPDLKPGLDALHDDWWAGIDARMQRLALILAAAGAPLPAEVCAELMESDPTSLLHKSSGWIATAGHPTSEPHYELYHWVTRDYLARKHGPALEQIHADIVALSPLPATQDEHTPTFATASGAYLLRQAARHAALGTAHTRTEVLPRVVEREWVRTHERQSGVLTDAAHDVAWEVYTAADTGTLLRLARSAALAGTLESLGRTMSPDDALAAFPLAIEQHGRENGLKRILALVDQLPDGQGKAFVLRQLGEACYGNNMRISAMRLLSQALDLEEQKIPRAWREQREQLLAALASAALSVGKFSATLAICTRIGHPERRGMVETDVVRWLLAQGELEPARELASSITHESLGAWAQAEVAVALARTGDRAGAEEVLANVQVSTAIAWAHIELACDDAVRDENAARTRIAQLTSQTQRDRGWARLSHALAVADKDGDALDVAGQISDVAVRVAALLDLRLTLEGLVAMLALEQATAEIDKLTGDARVPLLATLASAHATIGRRDRALSIVQQLAEGEERDRALSRVAVALAGQGNHQEGQTIAAELTDDDERDWTLEELTRILAQAGQWEEAQALGQAISAEELRARTLAELAIARARAADPLAALPITQRIPTSAERTRALMLMVPSLVASGHTAAALAIALPNGQTPDGTHGNGASPEAPSLPPGETSRYLAAIATALAEQGDLEQAQTVTRRINRPMERARSHLAIATAAVTHDSAHARAALGTALQAATLGRAEAFRLLEQAAPVLALLEGATLLTQIASEIDAIDTW